MCRREYWWDEHNLYCVSCKPGNYLEWESCMEQSQNDMCPEADNPWAVNWEYCAPECPPNTIPSYGDHNCWPEGYCDDWMDG